MQARSAMTSSSNGHWISALRQPGCGLESSDAGGASGSVRSRAERPRNLSSAGTFGFFQAFCESVAGIAGSTDEATMHQIIYLVGLIVVILAILSFFGLR
jgi:hypothetical protein